MQRCRHFAIQYGFSKKQDSNDFLQSRIAEMKICMNKMMEKNFHSRRVSHYLLPMLCNIWIKLLLLVRLIFRYYYHGDRMLSTAVNLQRSLNTKLFSRRTIETAAFHLPPSLTMRSITIFPSLLNDKSLGNRTLTAMYSHIHIQQMHTNLWFQIQEIMCVRCPIVPLNSSHSIVMPAPDRVETDTGALFIAIVWGQHLSMAAPNLSRWLHFNVSYNSYSSAFCCASANHLTLFSPPRRRRCKCAIPSYRVSSALDAAATLRHMVW